MFELGSIVGGVAVLVNAKLQNLLKPKGKVLKYALALAVSSGLVVFAKYGGGAMNLPDLSDYSWGDLALLDVVVFAMAGGFWDILKVVGVRKN